MSFTTTPYFKRIVGIISRLAVISLLVSISWITYLHPWRSFNLHPIAMTLSFVFSTLAILKLQEPSSNNKFTKTTLHLIYQLSAMGFLVVGMGIVIIPKILKRLRSTQPQPNRPHHLSWHATLGYIYIFSTIPIILYGFIARRPPSRLKPYLPTLPQLRAQHKISGFLAHLFMSTSLIFALKYQWSRWSFLPFWSLEIMLAISVVTVFIRVNYRKLWKGLFKKPTLPSYRNLPDPSIVDPPPNTVTVNPSPLTPSTDATLIIFTDDQISPSNLNPSSLPSDSSSIINLVEDPTLDLLCDDPVPILDNHPEPILPSPLIT